MPDAVSVRGLGARVGALSLLEDVTFEVGPGEVVALFGPSGAGKSTIASAVAGVEQPGVELSGTVSVTSRVGYLPQHAAGTLNPARRVGKALSELVCLRHGRQRWPRRRARIARVLRSAAFDVADGGLDRMLRRYPFEFSGGQRTRLALAQVLATEPEVLVLDEPTDGLDSVNRAELVDQLAVLRREGMAIVLVTHDPFVVRRLSDRTVHVRAGRLAPDSELPALAPCVAPSAVVAGEPAVELRNVSVPHRLRGVDLELRDGETLGVIGVSGAGKSSIARCIAGLLPPRRGELLVGGERFPVLRKRTRAQLAHVQHVWQESAASFEPRRQVLDQVGATGVRLRGWGAAQAEQEALRVLAEMGVEESQARRLPAGLSGGQLQRAALARAVLARPRVLICDEVTTGLDRPLSAEILDHVDGFRRDHGTSVINISHDVRSQVDRADRIAIVDGGEVVEVGTPGELLSGPRTPVLRELLAAEDLLAV